MSDWWANESAYLDGRAGRSPPIGSVSQQNYYSMGKSHHDWEANRANGQSSAGGGGGGGLIILAFVALVVLLTVSLFGAISIARLLAFPFRAAFSKSRQMEQPPPAHWAMSIYGGFASLAGAATIVIAIGQSIAALLITNPTADDKSYFILLSLASVALGWSAWAFGRDAANRSLDIQLGRLRGSYVRPVWLVGRRAWASALLLAVLGALLLNSTLTPNVAGYM